MSAARLEPDVASSAASRLAPHSAAAAAPWGAAAAPGRPGLAAVLGVETAKLWAQRRARLTLLLCAVAPFVVTVVLDGQQRPPKDTLFGRFVHQSGFAAALFLLTFVSQWVLPFLTAIVAGDIFASEDHFGTWKTVLTRSASRAQLFVAKCVTAALYAVTVLLVLGTATIVAGLVLVGHQPLIGLTGQPIAAGSAFGLVAAAWASAAPPLLAFTAIALLASVLSRNPAVGVVAPIMLGLASQLLGWLGGMDRARRLLPTNAFDAWHGLFTAPRFLGLLVQGVLVSAGWCLACAVVAYAVFRRRDVTGG